MANNKVQLANGTVLIDITDTTANASDVLSGEYFYDASGVKTEGSLTIPLTYTVTKTLTNVTTSNNDTEVLAGGSFYMDLTLSSGMVIGAITVTMGGIDITEQVFKAGVGEKIITQNGIYDAEDDWLEGYSEVTVNVPNTYTSSDEGKVVSGGILVMQTSDTVTQNGTVDTTLINSLTVNVSGGSTPTGTKQIYITENGIVTEDITDYANVEITTNVSGGGGLPSAYQQVEYLQADGTQYINTGIIPNSGSEISVKAAILASGGYFGILQSVSNGYSRWHFNRSATKLEVWRQSSGNTVTINPDNSVHDYYISNSLVRIDATAKAQTTSQYETTLPFYLFARNSNGTAGNFCSAKLYFFSISQNSVLKMMLVPCYRKSDSKPGMYDILNGVFFTNDGTGEFSVGGNV